MLTRITVVLMFLWPHLGFPGGSISGKVADNNSNPVGFATVALYGIDSLLISGTITDIGGAFELNPIRNGDYYLVIQFVGFENKFIGGIQISNTENQIQLGTIFLEPNLEVLKEIEISADKFYLENKIDRKVIQIDQSLTSVSGDLANSLLEMSAFSTNASGMISFRGSQNFKVLIDGKPSAMSGSEALQSIPASYVEEIEIMTNPSARYLSDSEAGIINVIMKKSYTNGISGHIGSNLEYRNQGNYVIGSQGNIHFKKERYRLYVLGSYDADSIQLDGNTTIQRIVDENWFIRQRMARQLRWATSFNGQAGFEFLFNDKHIISLWSNYSIGNSDYRALANDFDQKQVELNSYGTLDYHNTRKAEQIQFTLDDNIELENGNLQLLLDYSKSNNKRDNYRDYYSSDSLFSDHLEQIDETYFDQFEDRFRWHSEANLAFNINDSSVVETGILYEKYFRKNLLSEYYFNELRNDSEVNYKFQIGNAYLTYTSKIGKLDYSLGTRVEYSTRSLIGLQRNRLFTIFPSVHVKRILKNEVEIMFSYSKKIRRPTVYDLSPILLYADNQVTWSGNSTLKDAMVHVAELQGTLGMGSLTINSSIFYRYTNKGWFRFLQAAENNTFINYPLQVIGESNVGIDFITDLNVGNKFNFKASTTLYKQQIIQQNNLPAMDNFSSRINASVNYLPSETLSLQLNGVYKGPQLAANSVIKEAYFLTFQIRKDFLNKKLKLTFAARDFLSTDIYQQRYNQEIASNQRYELREFFASNSRYFALAINYTFSNYKNKRVNKNIQVFD